MSTLFVTALPIGNSKDITLHAQEVLAAVDFIACEDTRKLKNWLQRTSVNTSASFYRYNKDNEKNSSSGLIQILKEGKSGALVSDAGTPKISDPGYDLVRQCWLEKINIKPIPGVSSLTTLLSVSPFSSQPLLFLGFLPPKEGKRRRVLEDYSNFSGVVALFASVHRVVKVLKNILQVWGNVEVFIGRELTKVHEEYFWGQISEAIEFIDTKKGEFAILINKKGQKLNPVTDESLRGD